ncbi:hypothetical protein PsYK624_121000 [Phanerochaete sordida]|uniref:F-box domain-containing protein n=1 Tax=Phanerochaete sordida TaxID=48140 RepID=A0A9P3GKF0_9APHY|nr:hypothetical protein PsYK624_121000 [Phanerochaete sordida]
MTEDVGCRLPQEVVDMVIDYLYDDRRSLRQCSLTCKAWEPSSTMHLFLRISWPPHKVHWSFPEEIEALHNDPYYTASFDDCYALLLSSPRIRNAVCHLRLTGLRSHGRSGLSRNQSHEPLPLTFLFALPELLPGLQTLEIWDLAFGVLEPPPSVSLELPRTLKKLAF